jgi:hypothetical protein
MWPAEADPVVVMGVVVGNNLQRRLNALDVGLGRTAFPVIGRISVALGPRPSLESELTDWQRLRFFEKGCSRCACDIGQILPRDLARLTAVPSEVAAGARLRSCRFMMCLPQHSLHLSRG